MKLTLGFSDIEVFATHSCGNSEYTPHNRIHVGVHRSAGTIYDAWTPAEAETFAAALNGLADEVMQGLASENERVH